MVSVSTLVELVAECFPLDPNTIHFLCSSSHNPGTCTAAGYSACCEIGFCAGYPASCFCDYDCHQRGDCCHDVSTTCAESTYRQTKTQEQTNTLMSNTCVHKHTFTAMHAAAFLTSYTFNYQLFTFLTVVGSCIDAGYDSCCVSGGCEGVPADSNCYCDSPCLNFDDCCEDFQQICPGQL